MDDAIRRPDAANHFMVLKPVNRRVLVKDLAGRLLAESRSAIRLLEAGRTLYDPVLYFPRGDVVADLQKVEKSSFCPLKGTASYYDINAEPELAWSYENPLDFAGQIKGLVAFYQDRVTVEEHPS